MSPNPDQNPIRGALAVVTRLRAERLGAPELASAVAAVKRIQAQRFAGTYAQLLRDSTHGPAARFFLTELYAPRDFSARDAQFAQIAGTIETVFPASVVDTCQALASLHCATEELDHQMGGVMVQQALTPGGLSGTAEAYVTAWQTVGQPAARQQQLRAVLRIGEDLARLVRTPGLRTLLRLMRRPAAAAGLTELQRFLEMGFDTFADLTKQAGGASAFLAHVEARETALMERLFGRSKAAAVAAIAAALGASA